MNSFKRFTSRSLAVIIVLQLIFTLFLAVPANAEDGADIVANPDTGEVSIVGTAGALSGKQASLMVFAPGFDGNVSPLNDALVALDQFAVDTSGNYDVSVKIANPVTGEDYSVYVNGELIGVFQFEAAGDEYLYGDVDLNGEILLSDALLLQKSVAKLTVLNDIQKEAGDTYIDGLNSLKDVLVIQKFVAGKNPGSNTQINVPFTI